MTLSDQQRAALTEGEREQAQACEPDLTMALEIFAALADARIAHAATCAERDALKAKLTAWMQPRAFPAQCTDACGFWLDGGLIVDYVVSCHHPAQYCFCECHLLAERDALKDTAAEARAEVDRLRAALADVFDLMDENLLATFINASPDDASTRRAISARLQRARAALEGK